MTFQPVPWAIDGGAENSAEVARLLAYVATRSERGTVLPADCQVQALDVPAGQVRVTSGALVIPNAKPGAGAQTYLTRNESEHLVNIAPTGVGVTRSDLVYVRISDPQYSDEPVPASVPSGPYVSVEVITNVAPTTATLEDAVAQGKAPAGRTGYALARIDLPASTTNVTPGLIVDLRKVANPRSRSEQLLAFPSTVTTLTSSAFVTFPSVATWSVDVPSWATHAIVRIDGAGLKNSVACAGQFRASLGGELGQSTTYDVDTPASGYNRNPVLAAGTIAIPDALRGTTQTLKLEGKKTSGSGALTSDTGTSVVALVQFIEKV